MRVFVCACVCVRVCLCVNVYIWNLRRQSSECFGQLQPFKRVAHPHHQMACNWSADSFLFFLQKETFTFLLWTSDEFILSPIADARAHLKQELKPASEKKQQRMDFRVLFCRCPPTSATCRNLQEGQVSVQVNACLHFRMVEQQKQNYILVIFWLFSCLFKRKSPPTHSARKWNECRRVHLVLRNFARLSWPIWKHSKVRNGMRRRKFSVRFGRADDWKQKLLEWNS